MPIRVVCPSCECGFSVAEQAAGKRRRCPRCREPLTIPPAEADRDGLVPIEDDAPYELERQVGRAAFVGARSVAESASAPPLTLTEGDLVTTATLTPAQILSAFDEYIEPVRPTMMYRFWIVAVACVMFLLPMIYLALVALVGLAVFWHATTNLGILTEPAGVGGNRGNAKGRMLVYFTPLIAGVVLLAFLVKPIFARSGKRSKSRSLDPSKEPLLFAFVDGVCSTVSAPSPSRIDVVCEVNAFASFEGGPFAFFNRRPVLTIGLPLVAGMDLKQFAGVLAHEFGHLSQGAGMRLSYMIRSVNLWFARVVYERDAWDQTLDEWSRGGDFRVMIVVWVIRGVVWLSRRVLWALMMVGHMASCILDRQSEFDADRYQVRMVGGEVFESTFRRLHVLNAAMQGAYADLASCMREGRLPDNLPKLIVANVAQIPPEGLEKIDEQVTEGRTGLFDTHPCDRERIFHAHAEDADGVFSLDGPGSDVFRDFDGLCRASTLDFYRLNLGKHGVDKDSLRPVGDVVRTTTAAVAGHKALERFYQGVFDPLRPFLLPEIPPAAPADLASLKKVLISARQKMASTIDDYEASARSLGEHRETAARLMAAAVMIKAEFKFRASEFGLDRARLDVAKDASARVDAEVVKIDEAMSVRESAVIRRIHAALSLLQTEAVLARVADGVFWREESEALYPVARHVGRSGIPALAETYKAHQCLLQVLSKWSGNEQNERLHNAIRRAAKLLADQLLLLQGSLGGMVAYPFDHAEGMISIGRYALPNLPPATDVSGLLSATQEAINKMIALHYRLVGCLMLAAEEVEKALGMPSLPERPRATAEAVS